MTDRAPEETGKTKSGGRKSRQEPHSTGNPFNAPFSPGAIATHVRSLHVRADSIDDKIGYLRRRAAGKRVLDVEVVEHDYEATKSEAWLHRHLSQSAASCLGIDILHEPIARLQADGYNVIVHDLCESPLFEDFDLIVMGQLIEHFGDSQRLLKNASRTLAKDECILLTSQNPWYINAF